MHGDTIFPYKGQTVKSHKVQFVLETGKILHTSVRRDFASNFTYAYLSPYPHLCTKLPKKRQLTVLCLHT